MTNPDATTPPSNRDDRSRGFLTWQLEGYADNHKDRVNLWIHAATVPLFVLGLASLVTGLTSLAWVPMVSGLASMGLAVAAQGYGHRREALEPVPFRSPLDALRRIVSEQCITYWRFVARRMTGR